MQARSFFLFLFGFLFFRCLALRRRDWIEQHEERAGEATQRKSLAFQCVGIRVEIFNGRVKCRFGDFSDGVTLTLHVLRQRGIVVVG